MGNNMHRLWSFPRMDVRQGRLWRTQAVLQLPEGSLLPLRYSVLQAEDGCRRRWRAGWAACSWDACRCLEGHTALGPLVTVSLVPMKAEHALRGRNLFTAAIGSQWKAGRVSLVMAGGEESTEDVPAHANYAWLLAVLQRSHSWAPSW